MKLTLLRLSDDKQSTQGALFVDGVFFCYTLEDEYREQKVMHETRIDCGVFPLEIQRIDTPMTKRYREKHSWFKHHIEITGLPRHTSIYIHIGNKESHTSGCILVGDKMNNNQIDDGVVESSTYAFKRLYEKIYPSVEAGNATIEVIDFDRWIGQNFQKEWNEVTGFDKVVNAVEQMAVQPQNTSTDNLPLRVGILEQKVKSLEARVN